MSENLQSVIRMLEKKVGEPPMFVLRTSDMYPPNEDQFHRWIIWSARRKLVDELKAELRPGKGDGE